MATRFVGLSLDPKLVEKIDRTRGLVNRSRFVEEILKRTLD